MTTPLVKHPARRVLALIQAEPWACTREALAQIIEIAARENRSVEALEAALGEPLANTYDVNVRDGVATLHLTGPFFRYANLFTRISGASSLETMAPDLVAAIEDPRVSAMLFAIDSPGGTVSGTSEFADLLYRARSQKRVVAHIDGVGASGAYWIASAAERITASNTSVIGSIGVVMAERQQEDDGTIEFVSSQSPRKRTEPTTDIGRADRQALVDSLAEQFIGAIARNRNVEVDLVREEFGQGGVFVGQEALDVGMIDAISTYEEVHAELVAERRSSRSISVLSAGARDFTGRVAATTEGSQMANPKDGQPATLTADQLVAQYPEHIEAIRAAAHSEGESAGREAGRAEGVAAENARILAIESLTIAGGEEVVAASKRDIACTKEMAAVKLVQAQQGKTVTDAKAAGDSRLGRLQALKGDETSIEAPKPGPTSDTATGDAAAVARILAAAHAVAPLTPTRN